MASDEDNFDIDVYGDGGEEFLQDGTSAPDMDASMPQVDGAGDEIVMPKENYPSSSPIRRDQGSKNDNIASSEEITIAQKIASTDETSSDLVLLPKQAPQTQGIKRKEGEEDDRPVEANATTALFISDLHWWVTDDDIRGWANQSQCEDELEEITFNEHKVNGKSKGQAYVSFTTPQSATALKAKIESFAQGQRYSKPFAVNFTNPSNNPFRTLPKDGPMRNPPSSGNPRSGPSLSNSYSSGGFRGRGYNRGNNSSNYNRGGYQSGFQASSGGNFSQMGSASYGGFQGRGSMGGMRGSAMGNMRGRGGMMGMGMGMGMPMGAMGMGMGMGMGIGMPGMGPMAMGGNPGAFNPAFFNNSQSSSGFGTDNPHGIKRTRHD